MTENGARSPLGGWTGEGHPEHGDFVKVKRGNVHIINYAAYGGARAVCDGWYPLGSLTPASGDEPKQCRFCWEAM